MLKKRPFYPVTQKWKNLLFVYFDQLPITLYYNILTADSRNNKTNFKLQFTSCTKSQAEL